MGHCANRLCGLAAILSAATWAPVVLEAAENLLTNPGFEMLAGDGNSAAGWTAATTPYSYVAGGGRNGTRAIFFDVSGDSPYAFASQAVNLERGRRYTASAWVRTENIVGMAEGALIGIEWKDELDRHLSGAYARGVVGTTEDWTQIQVVGEVPRGAVHSRLVVFVRRGATGRAWFDDLRVEPFEQPLIGHLQSDAYRDCAMSGPVTFFSFTGSFAARMADEGLRGVFSVQSAEGGETHEIEAVFADGALCATVDAASLPIGESKVALHVANGSGRECAREEMVFRRLSVEPDWKVRIDRTGLLIVDGKPFYPLGVFVSSANAKTISDVKKGPFNCILPYCMPTREQMDACHAAGLKVIYNIKDAFPGMRECPVSIKDNASAEAWIRSKVGKFRDHPALLAWYINDEAGPEMAGDLTRRRALLAEIDPDHPTYACENQIEHLREYAGTFDIIGSDPYPVAHPHRLNAPISMVAEWTEKTRAAFPKGIPVWEVPQIFDWGGFIKDSASVTRAPTEEEMRNMAWQCIASGADGVLPWSYLALGKTAWRDSPDVQWEKVCRVYAEIARYVPVLLSTDASPAVAGMPENVFARTWRHDGVSWLLVVNASQKPLDTLLIVEGVGEVAVSLDPLGVEMRSL